MFRSPAMLMPHESTVSHDKSFMGTPGFIIPPSTGNVNNFTPAKSSPVTPNSTPVSTPAKQRLTKRADSQVPNLFAEPPAAVLQTHELDDDEEDHDSHESS